jgi:hypothetical protein
MTPELEQYDRAREALMAAIRAKTGGAEEFARANELYVKLSDADIEELKRRMQKR